MSQKYVDSTIDENYKNERARCKGIYNFSDLPIAKDNYRVRKEFYIKLIILMQRELVMQYHCLSKICDVI